MRKLAYILSLILETACFIGMFVLDFFANSRLGMNRWLVYNNQKWEEAFALPAPLLACEGVLLLLLIAVFVMYARRHNRSPLHIATITASALVMFAFLLFTVMNSLDTTKVYYLDLLLFVIAGLIQIIRSLIILRMDFPMRDESELSDEDQKLARTNRIARWATCVALAIFVIICSFVPAANEEITYLFDLLSEGNISDVADEIASFSPAAAAVSFFLMILQSIAAPIPAFLITFANAMVFGWWQGALLSWTSAMVGAALCFYIARALGRDAVAHFVTTGALASRWVLFEYSIVLASQRNAC